ncbi:MAG TPA: sulfite exporter TauE/SafE family protein [Miltoncostaeaceae bacterium]|nr:sulfite exporter TauE/SafE family protein [Miltoncostaeaceae bacterium]
MPDIDLLIVVFGLGVGFLVGTTGMGGGSLMTPLLIIVFGIKPVLAIGTDLAYAAVTKTVGGWQHFRQGTVDLGIALWLGVGSIPGALVGVWLLGRIEDAYGSSFDTIVLVMVAVALFVTSVAVLARALFVRDVASRERTTVTLDRRHKAAAIGIGVAVGIVLGVTSAGSGALIALGLILVFRLTPHRVVGTDVFHAAILLWVAGAAHFASGNVDVGLALNILIGSVPGVWIGSKVAMRLPAGGLRPALGIVLFASAMGLLSKAGADIPPAAFVAVPLALVALVWLVHVIRRPRVPAVEAA